MKCDLQAFVAARGGARSLEGRSSALAGGDAAGPSTKKSPDDFLVGAAE
ncbi:MAG: hypothetical protein LBK95_07810 [Bifidobacteriaceae bacterium]|nr:hypothetical protein [Bifidobacteriaceae bacterium]